MATSADHSVGVDGAGHLWAWGANGGGQLGGPASTTSPKPPGLAAGRDGARVVAAGPGATLVSIAGGNVRAFGHNASGELGLAASTGSVPVSEVPGLDHVGPLAIGGDSTKAFSLVVAHRGCTLPGRLPGRPDGHGWQRLRPAPGGAGQRRLGGAPAGGERHLRRPRRRPERRLRGGRGHGGGGTDAEGARGQRRRGGRHLPGDGHRRRLRGQRLRTRQRRPRPAPRGHRGGRRRPGHPHHHRLPHRAGRAGTSNVNVSQGRYVSNLVAVKLAPDGTVKLYNNAGSVDVIADVAGWYAPAGSIGGDRFTPTAPGRVYDTRPAPDNTGTCTPSPCGPIGPGASASAKVAGQAAQGGATPVPAVGASAVVANITVVQPSGTGAASYLTAYPDGATQPLASNLVYVDGQIVPILATVKLGANGRIRLYDDTGTANVVADVYGWFNDGTS